MINTRDEAWDHHPDPARISMVGPLALDLTLFVAIPKSTTKRDRARIVEGSYHPTKKPDLDNVLKAITDAMNGIVYEDDAQIVRITTAKVYSDTPRAEVSVMARADEVAGVAA